MIILTVLMNLLVLQRPPFSTAFSNISELSPASPTNIWIRSDNATEILVGDNDDDICAYEGDYSLSLNFHLNRIRGKRISVMIKTTSEDVAGGTLQLPNGTVAYLDGSGLEALWVLRDTLNLTLDITVEEDYDEIFASMYDHQVELRSTLLTMTIVQRPNETRKLVAIPLIPFASAPSVVYFIQPRLTKREMRYSIFKPLANNSWRMVMACWGICAAVCQLLHRFPLIRPRSSEGPPNKNYSVSQYVLWIASFACGKNCPVNGTDPSAHRLSLRIAMISALNFTVIVTAIYTAKIAVYFSREIIPVKKPDDLLKFKYEFGTWSSIHIDRFFGKSNSTGKVEDVGKIDSTTILKKLFGIQPRKIKYAYLSQPDGFYFHDREVQMFRTEFCKISYFTSSAKTPMAMYLNRDSPFREVFNWKIVMLLERGIKFRQQEIYLTPNIYSCISKRSPVEKLSLEHTFFIFFTVGTGASIALILLALERIYNGVYRTRPYNL